MSKTSLEKPQQAMPPVWDFWIDRGGTFTDIIALSPERKLHTLKLLSENSQLYDDAILYAIRFFLQIEDDQPIPPNQIGSIKMGTTVATNALLEHKGEPTVFVTTRGFADALAIGDQSRPDLFALNIQKPKLLYEHVVRINERILADGTVSLPLDSEQARKDLESAWGKGFRCVAIALMNSYAFPQHEKQVMALAQEIGFTQISVSHHISPLIKFISRADSTVVDAYLSPVLKRYINALKKGLGQTKTDHNEDSPTSNSLSFMQSSGALVSAQQFQGKDAILSGPAGGVIGASQSAKQAGFTKIIGFDMGGTSTDVCHYNGQLEHNMETQIAGVKLRVPMLNIQTVAAGGGSLLHFDKHRFRVGPDSAGASPGPACYRNNGALALTDANVMTGKIKPAFFPHIFGKDGNQPIDKDIVKNEFLKLCVASSDNKVPEDIADGFIRIAVENMANAIKQVSIQNGQDITGYALNCFGGAGGQHACLVADKLGLETILIHPLSGLLSAYGMGLAQTGISQQFSVESPLSPAIIEDIISQSTTLKQHNSEKLAKQNVTSETLSHQVLVHLRYEDSDIAFPVTLLDHAAQMRSKFEESHKQRFGFFDTDKTVMVELAEVKTIAQSSQHEETDLPPTQAPLPEPTQRTQFYSSGQWHQAPLFKRDQLGIGHTISGPAIIIEDHQTVIVEANWRAYLTPKNHLVLSRHPSEQEQETIAQKSDPVMVEIFNNLFQSIAKQMGYVLQNTAQSVNIRDRKDFSCAIFDADGQLVANAPHMPVHLGSMDRSVQAVIMEAEGQLYPGDSFVINAPYNGGTHLPDITVVTPVFDETWQNIIFFAASRGHHSDIGGITPGSMSPNAKSIEQEGVYIDCFKLVDRHNFQQQGIYELLTSGDFPARQPEQNIADLKAQLAANMKGIAELEQAIKHYGLASVQNYMGYIQDNAEESIRRVISTLDDCDFDLETDDGRLVCVSISVDHDKRTAIVDFTGSSAQREDNFNAPEPVTRAAVLYVFRTLVNDTIPLNAGCLKPITLIIPKDSMLSPSFPAAVVAGNVETSQLITDCLFAAMNKLAPAQGTMNNLTFGNARYQYYETICSGAPAGSDFDGADGVHTHMTNSHMTDPEILELRYPVVVEQFAINKGSGGKGKHHAGDGTLRKIRFLEKMNCAILSSFREVAPPGLVGGKNGSLGENWVRKQDGKLVRLKGCDEMTLQTNEAIIIKTPTGGGFGKVKG